MRYQYKTIYIALTVILLGYTFHSSAQSKEQVWLDFQVDYPFANQYLFEITTSYQTVVTDYDKWRSLSFNPTFEYALPINWIDLIATAPMAFTLQKQDTNSFDIAPSLGGRFYFSRGKKIDTRLVVKYENRYFHEVETNTWEVSNRTRLKAEAWISINGPSMFTDKLWYALVDYEEYIVFDQQVKERFANRRRARLGLGYRLDYKRRFELIYTTQSSRDEIGDHFISNDNILQLRFKLFLNPAKNNDPTSN